MMNISSSMLDTMLKLAEKLLDMGNGVFVGMELGGNKR